MGGNKEGGLFALQWEELTMRRRPYPTLLVGQNSLLREGLAHILCADFRIIGSVADVREVPVDLLSQHHSILLIITSSDESSAVAAQIEVFKGQHPAGYVAVLVDQYRPADIVSIFQMGANACLAKTVTRD